MSNIKRSPMTYVPESPVANGPRRRRMRLGGMLALALIAWLAVASLTGDGSVEAQTRSLSVADFDQNGLQVVALASFTAGGATTLYSSADSRWGATGSLLEGDADLSADSKIVRVMAPARTGSLLRLNGDGSLVLREFFGESGAGADLTVWLQTDAGTTSFAANDFETAGSGYVNFNVPATGRAILTGIGAGGRFVLALTRPAPEPVTTPTPTPEPTPAVTELETESVTPTVTELVGLTTGTDPGDEDASGNEQVAPLGGKLTPTVSAKLDSNLNQLVHDHQVDTLSDGALADGVLGTVASPAGVRDDSARSNTADAEFPKLSGTVAVEVVFDQAQRQAVIDYLRSNGANVRDPLDYETALAANVPISLLAALSDHPGVQAVIAAQEPIPLNAGANAHGALRWHGATYRGAGVRIGVIDHGYRNYTRHIGSELPSPSGVRCYTADVNVQHTTMTACETSSSHGHGTTVTQMIYDVAPEAEYYIAVVKFRSDMGRIVDWFDSNDVDVVVISLGTVFEGPGDGTTQSANGYTGSLARAVTLGMTVAVAAGNSNEKSWYGTFTDSDNDSVLDWASRDECNTILLSRGTTYTLYMTWKDIWRGAISDLDVYATRGGVVQAKSELTQNGGANHVPSEGFTFTAARSGNYCIQIERRSGAIPSWAQIIINSSKDENISMEHRSDGYSVSGPGDMINPGALTVGAADYSSTSTIAGYSSRGPLPSGAVKPDIVGAAEVRDATTRRGARGTSFAAPHVGGLAALVKQRFPWYTPAEVVKFLKDHAQARGDPVPNNTWGFGFGQLGGTPASSTITISGVPEVGRTLTATATVSDPDGSHPFNNRWQWYRVDGRTRTAIAGATSRSAQTSTYTAVSDDEGKALAVRLEFTDGGDNHEEFFSPPTVTVGGEPTTFVSNLDLPGRTNHITLLAGRRIAQPFYTGRGSLGYNLRNVQIDVVQALPDDATYTVAIHGTQADFQPGARVVLLNGDLTTDGQQFFTPATPTVLNRDTRYYVVIHVQSLGSTPPLVNAYVEYKRLGDAIEATGWSLWNFSYYRSAGDTDWTQYDVYWGLAVRGDAVPADNTVSFSHGTYAVAEGSTANLTIELERPAAAPFTVPVVIGTLTTASSADYSGLPASVTFATGDTRKTFSVSGLQDDDDDDSELVYLAFGTLPSGIVSVAPANAFLFINDDDLPDVTVAFGATSYSVEEGEEVEVTVTLSALAERAVEIPINVYNRERASADSAFTGSVDDYASSATDYSGVPATLSFTSDEMEQTFTFTATEEMIDDDGEQVVLSFGTLPSQVAADSSIHAGETTARDTATITLGDNDDPDVKVRFGAAAYTVGEGKTIAIPVELDVAPDRPVVIPFSTTAQGGISSTDYILVPSSSVTFAADETRKTLSFTAIPDSESSEEGEGISFSFGATLPDQVTVDTAIPQGETSARDTATVTITDVASVPGRPSIDTVGARFRQLLVTWTAPTTTGGADVTSYDMRYILSSRSSSDKADPANWTRGNNVWQTDGGDLTHTLRGLSNGSSYDVQVAATNSIGTSFWSASKTGTPFIANHPPEFPASETGARGIAENAALGANIGAPVRASDPDTRTLSYALKAESDHISINGSTGQLQVKALLDYETATVHTVTVTVSDLANPNGEANEVVDVEIEVTITVRNVDESPDITGDAAIEVVENSTDVLDTYSAVDPEGAAITVWSVRGLDFNDFTISQNGELSFTNTPDFDAPTDSDGNNVYLVRVRARDNRREGRFDVVVTVTGVDEAPVIKGDATADFPENSALAVATYTAEDPEGSDSYWQELSGTDASLFQLTASGELRFLSPPDHESPSDGGGNNSYDVILTASDRDTGGETATLDVTVNVTPVNEPPEISGERVPNFTEEGTGAVATYTVSDPEGTNTTFTWALEGADRNLFDLTASGTGHSLAFKTPPNFETPADSGSNNEYEVTIKATADDTTTGTLEVLVTVRNVNDAPTLTGGPATITVAEDVTGTIGTYTATDPERATIEWSVTGTDDGDFTINQMGQLSFATGANYERQTSHSITVVASDGAPTTPLTDTRDVTVTVTGVDEPPDISPAADIEWDENSSGSVATFTATDPEGQRTTFTFSLEGDDAGDFTLTSAGVLTFQDLPDYEAPADADTNNEYLITVEADDGDKSGSLDLTVTVGDVNEPPTITPTGNITRLENSTGTVADYSAVDPEGVTDTFTWSLSGDDAADFRLHAESGSLIFVNSPDYDDPADADGDNVYLVTIGVTDGDLQNSMDVEVTVTNVNEPPVISGDAAITAITKAENFVGTLATYTAEDQEGVTAFVWSLDGTDKDDLEIDASTGALSFQNPPDYDNPIDSRSDGSSNTYNVIVRATEPDDQDSQTTQLADTIEVLVTVTDTNELPVIKGPTTVTDFPENSATTTAVGDYSVSDPERASVTWGALTGDDAGAFTLSSAGELTFEEPPDFETKATYAVTLNASDGENPATLDVTVSVTNVNEAPMVARETGTGAFSITENSGTAVGTFVAPDPEFDNVGWTVAGTDARHFEISQSGALSFKANPDHDNPLDSNSDGTRNTYNVIVRATEEDDQDSGTTELRDSLAVLVRVTDVDEAPVVEGPRAIEAFPENSDTTTVVGRYSATDPEGRGWTWSDLSEADASSFELSSAGVLTFEDPPNYEMKDTYTVTLNASDGTNTGSLTVTVTVVDVDEPPMVERSTGSGAFTVAENSGTAVGSFTAPDPERESVTWSLARAGDHTRFLIDDASGALSFRTPPDYESPDLGNDEAYQVTVRATEEDDQDAATTELSGSLAVVVKVTDVDEAPVITAPSTVTSGSIAHAENRTNNTVARFTATDPEGRTVVWQTLTGDDAGDFSFTNGTLSFVATPNFEDPQDTVGDNTYNVTLRAADGANTATYDLAVSVTNAPEDGMLGLGSKQPQTETALTATLTDPDVVEATTWKWERSTSRTSGWALITGETNTSYTPVASDETYYLRVTAAYTDGYSSGQSLMATSRNPVQLRPPDNTAPEFGSTAATREVAENSAADTNVGAPVTAGDAEDAGDLAYTLSGSSLFTIVGDSGQIKVAAGAKLNREDDAQHTVTVTATDPSELTDEISVTIDVTDVNEHPTAVTDAVSTNEDTAVTFGVLANDSDPETSATSLTVRLGSTAHLNAGVTLDSATKEFTYTPNQDFHGAESFTYRLSDGTHSVPGTVNVSVVSVNDLPDFGATSTERSISENAEVGDSVGAAVAATDRDHATLSYSLSGAADFSIDGDGQIKVARALDHETTSSYAATVTVEDGERGTASIPVTITVADFNEPPTAGDDEVTIDEDVAATIDVLANDSDQDTLPADLTVALLSTRVPKGSATVDPVSNQITFTPNANVNGLATFDYRVMDDGNNRDVGTVRVNIREVNDAPVFEQDPNPDRLPLSVREGVGEGVHVGAPVTASDVDDDPLTYSMSGHSDLAIDQVTAQISVAADVTIDRERVGTYDATVTANDNRGGTDTIRIRITVSDVPDPPVVIDHQVTAVEDTPLSIAVLTGAVDPDTELAQLAVRVTTQPSYGQAEVESDKTVTYRPDLDSTNQDSFEYAVSDGRNTDEGFVYITSVEPVNDAPTYVLNAVTFEMSEDSEPGDDVGYALTATDVDGDTPTYSLTGSVDFAVDPVSGQITTASYLDAIAMPTHTVTVTATDSASPPLTATVEVTITVVVGEAADTPTPPSASQAGGGPPIILPPGGGGGGGGGPTGPTPSDVEFEWTVSRDIEALDPGHGTPSGMWSDGVTLFMAENGEGADDAVYAYDLATGERVEAREFALHETNRAPRGFWSNRETVWVSDSGRERLFAYTLESGEREEEREFALARRNSNARGIWSDGETMWVLDGNRDALFAYNLETGELLMEYELDSANGDPQGVWSDGVSIWVSDHVEKRLFAYRLPTAPQAPAADDVRPLELERVRPEEFTELPGAGNNSPRGIWTDGEAMYVADESDGRVYSYNMPDAIDARLASLAVEGVEIGEFDPGTDEYTGVAAEDLAETTVAAAAAQSRATVVIEPADADELADGHQLTLEGVAEITVTVTSADGTRTRVYRVGFEEAGPAPDCLRGVVVVGFSILIYEGGSIGDLVGCAESRHVTALYALEGGAYVSYILGAPEFVNRSFLELYAEGVPATTLVIARSDGPATADPSRGDLAVQSWPECLRGEISAGFSLVLYEGGSVEELDSCAGTLDVTALYALEGGVYAAYILGAPAFVNAGFRDVFPDGLPVAAPLIAKSEEGSTS